MYYAGANLLLFHRRCRRTTVQARRFSARLAERRPAIGRAESRMQWWQFALLGAAGGVIIEALEIFRGLSQWQRARRDRNGRLKRLPAKLGQFVDGPAHAYMLPARAVLGAGAAVLFGMTGQVTGAYGVVAFGCAAPVLLTQLDRPAGAGHPDQFLVGRPGRGAAQVAGELVLAFSVAGESAADQQVTGPAGRLAAVFGQGGGRQSNTRGPLDPSPQLRRFHACCGACAARAPAREVPALPGTACLLSTATT
jgi:hypothetical protein